MSPALLVIDMQQEFFKSGPLAERRALLSEKINELVDLMHEKKHPVIWVRQEYKANLSDAPLHNRRNNKPVTIEGTEECKILPELHRDKGDSEIIKKRFSAFLNTELETLLKKRGIDTLIITGVNTMTCVRVTAIDAYQRDYNVILALEGVDAYDKEQHDNSIKYLQYSVSVGKTNEEISQFIRG